MTDANSIFSELQIEQTPLDFRAGSLLIPLGKSAGKISGIAP
jgi:hypothetical protein